MIVLTIDQESGVDLVFDTFGWDSTDEATAFKAQRLASVEIFWTPILAFVVSGILWPALEILARNVAARWYPPPPPFLGWWDSRKAFYSEFVPEVDFVEREERARLDEFLNDDAPFCWWWVTGEGGVGKSRLVREWATRVRGRLRRGFNEFDVGLATGLDDFSEAEWRAWQPRMPTVIVVEDAGDRPEPALRMIRGLSDRQAAPAATVRIVLVERSVPESLQILDEKTALMHHRYSQPLHLKQLTDDQLNKLLANWSKRTGSTLPVDVAIVIQRASGLPLYALLELATQGGVDGAHTALDKFAERSRQKLVDGGLDENVVPVVALASLTRGLGWETTNAYRPELRDKPDIKPTLDRLFATDCAGSIPAIRPDILAGYFVLAEFQRLAEPDRRTFLDAAWKAAPDRVARTLMLIHLDFPDHKALPSLDRLPKHAAARLWWGRVRAWLIHSIGIADSVNHWSRLRDTAAVHPDDADLALALAEGAINAVNRYGEEKRWDEMTRAFHALRQVAERHPDNTDIQLDLAGGTVNAVSRYGEGQRWDKMTAALDDLRQMAERHPENAGFLSEFTAGAANAVARLGDGQRWGEMSSALADLREVAERHPDNTEIQLDLAIAARNAAVSTGVAKRWDKMAAALAELNEIADRCPDHTDIQLQRARGAVGSIELYGAGQRWDEMAAALEHLRQAADWQPERPSIQVELTKGLVNAAARWGKGQRWEEMVGALDELRQVAERHSDNTDIQLALAHGAANTVIVYGKGQRQDEMTEALAELRQVADRHPDNTEIQLQHAKGAVNAILGYGDWQHWKEMTRALGDARAALARVPDSPEIQDIVGRGEAAVRRFGTGPTGA